jgi:hypothetical protein
MLSRLPIHVACLCAVLSFHGVGSASPPIWFTDVVDASKRWTCDPASPASILHHAVQIDFKKDHTELQVRTAVQVNLASGLEFASLVENVGPMRQAKNVRGWSWDGRRFSDLDLTSVIEVGHPVASGIYTDDRILVASLPHARPGCIVGYEYQVVDKDDSRLSQILRFPQECDALETGDGAASKAAQGMAARTRGDVSLRVDRNP